jgi:hypothetical protein
MWIAMSSKMMMMMGLEWMVVVAWKRATGSKGE